MKTFCHFFLISILSRMMTSEQHEAFWFKLLSRVCWHTLPFVPSRTFMFSHEHPRWWSSGDETLHGHDHLVWGRGMKAPHLQALIFHARPWGTEGGHCKPPTAPSSKENRGCEITNRGAPGTSIQRVHARPATQSCLTLCKSMDCSPPRFCVHGIFQARILEWVATLADAKWHIHLPSDY